MNFDELSDIIFSLSDGQAGKMYKALLLYFKTGEMSELDPDSLAAFEAFRQAIEQDEEEGAE